MKMSSLISAALCVLAATCSPALIAQEIAPVRMGAGDMTFDTVPGWGLSNEGLSQIGSTHGGVVVDEAGLIYTTSSLGIFVFNSDGKIVTRFLGDEYSNIHDIEIRKEGADEFLYAARNRNAEGLKISAATGDIVLNLKYPEKSGLNLKTIKPTAITVAENGDIYLSDGYGSNTIFVYNRDGEYQFHFGEKGNELKQFNTAHGMTLDTRYTPHRLLICDRNHKPKGRLLHYDLKGQFVEEVITGLGMPTSVAIQGQLVSVPDLQGRLVILDGTNKIISVLGHNPDARVGGSFQVPQEKWVEGIFSGTHGSYWDADGNLYVQDWNVSGRIIKLMKVRR